jgi:tryptophan-rich sensory protein
MENGAATGRADWIGLIVALAICFAVAGVASLATTPEIPGWYARLKKPSWTPPNWLFGPVWTTLYAAMAVAAWLVWRRGGWRENSTALALFIIQLALNFAWSFIFFRFHQTGLAFAEIVLLWVAIAATIVRFASVSKVAAALMVPYLLWVTYASALNFAIWRLNE